MATMTGEPIPLVVANGSAVRNALLIRSAALVHEDDNNNITSICTPTPEYETSRLRILGPRQAHLELWPLANYDRVSLPNSRRPSAAPGFAAGGTAEHIVHDPLHLMWTDLKYTPRGRSGLLKRTTTFAPVLNKMSGQLTSGTMTALMGPSGAGKSSLLNCIAGKITRHVSGQVFVRFSTASSLSQRKRFRISFVPQRDHMFKQFTVRETIMFASRIHSPDAHPFDHKWNVQETLGHLDLVSVADSRLSKLSGGELRRTSIALELISYPSVLMLDEPTTGLDSDNSETIVRLLKNLSKPSRRNPPAIIASIHQPSADALMMFDNVYLLNYFGDNIFSGPPQGVMDYFDSFGFDHKTSISPAEHMIEVANGKLGGSRFKEMEKKALESVQSQRTTDGHDVPLHEIKSNIRSTFWRQFHMNLGRSYEAYTTKSVVILLQLLLNMIQTLLAVHLSIELVSKNDGCWTSILNLTVDANTTEEEALRRALTSNDSSTFDLRKQADRMAFGTIFLYSHPILYMFMSMLVSLIIFPMELKTVCREISNKWYGPSAYFVANTVWQVIAILVTITPAVTYSYVMSGFPFDDWRRFPIFAAVCFLQCLIWTSRGLFFSVVFAANSVIGALVTGSFAFLTLFFSGFLIPIHRLNPIFKPFAGISDIMYEMSSLMTAVYGYCRCSGGQVTSHLFRSVLKGKSVMKITGDVWSTFNVSRGEGEQLASISNVTYDYFDPLWNGMHEYFGSYEAIGNHTPFQSSFVLDYYHIHELDVPFNLLFLVLVVVITRIFAWLALRIKTEPRRM